MNTNVNNDIVESKKILKRKMMKIYLKKLKMVEKSPKIKIKKEKFLKIKIIWKKKMI